MRRYVIAIALCCTLFFLPYRGAWASTDTFVDTEDYPTQPIQILVYTSPGGLIDLTARRFAEIANRYAEVPFVVINRPGGGGVVAFEEALRRPANGYTLLAVTRSNVSKMVSISREDLLHNVDWLGYVMDNAHVLIARSADYDFLHNKRQLWLGADIGGVKHVSAIKMAQAAGIDMRWIPFSSGGQAVAALLGNLGDIYLGNPRDALMSDQLHIVAVASDSRLAPFPDAPTFAELGIDGLANELIWRGFASRKGIPEERRAWLQNIIYQVTEDADWQAMWRNDGVALTYQNDTDFKRIVAQDIEEFRHYIGNAGLITDSESTRPAHWTWLVTMVALVFVLCAFYTRRIKQQPSSEIILYLIMAVLTLAFALLHYIPAASTIDPIGPRGVPLLWMLLLAIGCMGLLLSSYRHGERAPLKAGRFLLNRYLILLLLYLAALYFVGYVLATLLISPLLLLALQRRDLKTLILTPFAWTLFSWGVFEKLLGVGLPTGIFC